MRISGWLGLFAALSSIAISTSGEARADLILGNLPQVNDNFYVNIGGSGGTALSYAMEFTMGNSGETLTDAMLRLNLQAPASDAPVLALFSNNGSKPGSSLATFTTPGSLATGTSTVDFTLTYSLQAQTSYWLVLSGGPNSFNWDASYLGSSPYYGVAPTGPGATQAGLATGLGTGNSRTFTAKTVGAASPYASYQLNGTPAINPAVSTPEPSTLVMAGLGVIFGLAARCRRCR